MARFSFKWMDI